MKVHYQRRKQLGLACESILRKLGCEFVALDKARVGFAVCADRIYTPAEIASVPLGIVNLHLSPLPHYRGFYSFSHAIANGETDFCVTLHYVDTGIDTGPIIDTTPVEMIDNPILLAARATRAGYELFKRQAPRILLAADRGERVPSTPQPEGGRYYDRDSLPPEQRF